MARTRKLNPEERLEKVNDEIDRLNNELRLLQEEKQSLEEQIKASQLEQLYSIIKNSGKSFDEVLELIGEQTA